MFWNYMERLAVLQDIISHNHRVSITTAPRELYDYSFRVVVSDKIDGVEREKKSR